MAHVHGRAGMYPTTQAERMLGKVLAIALASMLLFGFIAGAAFFGLSPWLGAIVLVLASPRLLLASA